MSSQAEEAPEGPLFRAAKRRKVFRRREESPDAAGVPGSTLAKSSLPADDGQEAGLDVGQPLSLTSAEETLSVADLIRQRKLAKARKGGIEFSKQPVGWESRPTNASHGASQAVVPAERDDDILRVVGSRFAPQTGAVADTGNEHMTVYIESELARLRRQSDKGNTPQAQLVATVKPPSRSVDGAERQPVSVGQIQEVDLGPEASTRNIAMTKVAMRRIQAGLPAEEERPQPPPKMRLGRDGKSRPPPRKKRRGSGDLRRDEIVEALLRENKVDLFDLTDPSLNAARKSPTDMERAGTDTAADDALAEQFQREYLEAIASKREIRNKPPPGPTSGPPGANKNSEIAKGPKLGGSRSARAAMHAAEKEKEKARGTGFLPGGSARR